MATNSSQDDAFFSLPKYEDAHEHEAEYRHEGADDDEDTNEGETPPTRKRVRERHQDISAPVVRRNDTFRGYKWHLWAHGGAYTPFHHDASGLCTWIEVKHGAKCWIISRIDPKLGPEQRAAQFVKIVQNAGNGGFSKAKASFRSLTLTPGSILFVLL